MLGAVTVRLDVIEREEAADPDMQVRGYDWSTSDTAPRFRLPRC